MMSGRVYNKRSTPRKRAAAKPITKTTVTGRRVKLLKVAKPTNGSKPPPAKKVKKTVKPRKAIVPAKKPKSVQEPKKKSGVIKPKATAKRRAITLATKAKPPIASTTMKSVTFSLDAPTGLNVAVSGSFNSWVPQAMTKGPDGLWSIALRLAPGSYLYRFFVDTEWRDDPNNTHKTVDLMGGFCSVCEVL